MGFWWNFRRSYYLFAHISYVVCICVAFNKLVFLAFSYLNFAWCWNLKMMMIFAFLQIQLCITHFCRTKFLRRTVEINHMITVEISNWHWLLMAWPHINETHENIYDWNSFSKSIVLEWQVGLRVCDILVFNVITTYKRLHYWC